MTIRDRRDSFCGKMSACNNLTQYGIRIRSPPCHTVAPVPKLSARSGLVSGRLPCRARPPRLAHRRHRRAPRAFNTVRYSEKLLEANGISVETIDLSEILGRIARMGDDDPAAEAKLAPSTSMSPPAACPPTALMKMAKLGAVIDGWMQQTEVPSAPSNAGPRSKNISASSPAPS